MLLAGVLSSRQGRRLLQAELEQGLAGHLDRFAFLDHGAYRPGSRTDCGALAGIARDATDHGPPARSTDKTLDASVGAAAAFHLVIASEKGIRSAVHDDVGKFELQLGGTGLPIDFGEIATLLTCRIAEHTMGNE